MALSASSARQGLQRALARSALNRNSSALAQQQQQQRSIYSALFRASSTKSRCTPAAPVQQRQEQPQALLRRFVAAAAPSKQQYRLFSSKDDDSDDDFKPQRKAVPDDTDEITALIKKQVESNSVMLYMKGTPAEPRCGFSAQVVRILHSQGVSFSSVNVLDYATIREGIKAYSEWPTIPQLYVQGEFVGGCDILSQMHDSGELGTLFKEAKLRD